jgi:hypothetical protein
MSYLRRDSSDSAFVADRLPIYVFPAMVGSGRILLGMALAGITTAIMLDSRAIEEAIFWWLAATAYMSSLILVVSGIFAVNVVPGQPATAPTDSAPQRAQLPQRVEPASASLRAAAPQPASAQPRDRLGDLLVRRWKLVTNTQLSQALLERKESNRSLVFVLARRGLLTDEILTKILSAQAASQEPWQDGSRHA